MPTKKLAWLAAVVLLVGACSGAAKPAPKVSGPAATAAAPSTLGLRPGASGGPSTDPPTTATAATVLRPRTLVAVTTAGGVVALDPATGQVLRTMATGATGDEIGMTPDGATVFYETPAGCQHLINRVATAGTAITVVAPGSYPTVSPDGTQLAYVRQPSFTSPTACKGSDAGPSAFAVMVRNLSTGSETRFGLPPATIAGGLPLPIDHLSWAPDSRRLAVSIGGGQDNGQWAVFILDRTRDKYYAPPAAPTPAPAPAPPAVPVAVPVAGPKGTYYREAVFSANGDLFADRECCAGFPPHVTSSALVTVDPASGVTRQQVAVGVTTRDHTSLDTDGSGHWSLYLSGADLLVSIDGAKPTTLATGFQAAAW